MKRVKQNLKTIMLALGLLLSVGSATAQGRGDGPPPGGMDKIESLRIAFISERLDLTPEVAQKFWPVYNQYVAEFKALRESSGFGPGKPEPTADEALEFEQKKLDLKKKYKTQFEAVIGKDKVNMLYRLEEEFRQKLRELHDQRRGQGGHPGPPPGGGPPPR